MESQKKIKLPGSLKKAYLFYNPHSGKKKATQRADTLKRKWDEKFITPLIPIAPNSVKELRELAAKHYDKETLSVFMGGDGTISQGLQGIALKNKFKKLPYPVAMLPSGTGNSFLRDFSVTTFDEGVEALFSALENSCITQVDAGIISSDKPADFNGDIAAQRIFINILGFGLIPEIALLAEKMRFMGSLNYTIASLIKIVGHRNYKYKLKVDGKTGEFGLNFISLSNSKYTGGAMLMAPGASIDNGKLSMVRANIESRIALLAAFTKIFSGDHLKLPDIEHTYIKNFRIEEESLLNMNVDGDNELTYRPQIDVIAKYFSVFLSR